MHALPLPQSAGADIAPDSLSGLQQRRKRIVLISGLLMLIALLFSDSLWPSGSLPHEGSEMLGYALIFLCITGRSWCSLYIGGRKKTQLVDDGPYSISRNPLYLFSVLGGIGIGLQAGNLTAGLVCGLFVFAIFNTVIQREEIFLKSRFPAAFAAYAARVPRWGPRLSRWQSSEELLVRPRFVLVTFRDALGFLLAIPVLEAVEWAQAEGWLPVLLHLP
ncbi:isoprenylcysteine carboxylmethyltransferase family protein [Ferrovibrio terrae]|uniref:Isoprenylcysteine carboxylmethyltransferase family protein n=2 Tax=Ferrovibrio terrae TaxID=2594003 RepID=A0A516H7W8_9PROT|nr:isoprenylcysteine carboxylmethyltransferase family protein [Ferrovibrio terrae]